MAVSRSKEITMKEIEPSANYGRSVIEVYHTEIDE